eukprot:scaffold6703_cov296-Prasinococcus_capsulatus_cf.AAC.3
MLRDAEHRRLPLALELFRLLIGHPKSPATLAPRGLQSKRSRHQQLAWEQAGGLQLPHPVHWLRGGLMWPTWRDRGALALERR